TALIELGAGFHPDISGHENIIINGMLLGLSRKEVEARLDDIVHFAGVGDFIDQPIRTYSSGMLVRLGFSVAVAVDPDILLVDEVLAVGDEAFTRRCLDRIARMRREGVTLVIVSHDLDLVASLTDRALYLRNGRTIQDGPSDTVVARYRSDVADGEQEQPEDSRVRMIEEGRRWGTGDVEILDVSFSSGGVPLKVLPSGTDATVHIHYKVNEPVEDFVFGIAWHRTDGTLVAGHNTSIDGIQSHRLVDDGEVRCRYPRLDLAAGEYTLDVAVHAVDGLAYDYWCRAAKLRVTAPADWPGIWAPPHRWESDSADWEEPPSGETR
ncbi:MAG TPA: ABC transporter ATP-binding protein, partial [Acidobacteria bacterium]|nr:ABC transporter ATP-binding protein [Acidobacteriota bacterium]